MSDDIKDLYNNTESRMNAVVADEKYHYWKMLLKIKHEFMKDPDEFVDLPSYTREKYGIQMFLDEDSQYISPFFDIVDEKKYLLALLKFR